MPRAICQNPSGSGWSFGWRPSDGGVEGVEEFQQRGAGQVGGAISTGQDHLGTPQACRGGEQTLSVQRQAIEHLFEVEFGTENPRSIPLPKARVCKIFSARSEDFHRKIWAARQNQPSSIAMSTKEVTMSLRQNERGPSITHFSAAAGSSFGAA